MHLTGTSTPHKVMLDGVPPKIKLISYFALRPNSCLDGPLFLHQVMIYYFFECDWVTLVPRHLCTDVWINKLEIRQCKLPLLIPPPHSARFTHHNTATYVISTRLSIRFLQMPKCHTAVLMSKSALLPNQGNQVT